MNRKIYVLQINGEVLYCLSNASIAYRYLKKAVHSLAKNDFVTENFSSYQTVKKELDKNNVYKVVYDLNGKTNVIKITLFLLRTEDETPKKQFSFFKQFHDKTNLLVW